MENCEFKPHNFNIGGSIILTMYVYKQQVIFQVTQTALHGTQLYTPSKVYMNMRELNWLITHKNLNRKTEQFDRIGTFPSGCGFRVYRKDMLQLYPIDITSQGHTVLRGLSLPISKAYRKALSYISDQQSTISGDINALGDLAVACAVYYDTAIRKAGCKACRNNGETDPFQSPHACAFENIQSKHDRAEKALGMVTINMISSILASNELKPPALSMGDVIEADRLMMIRSIASHNVKEYCKKMLQKHISSHKVLYFP